MVKAEISDWEAAKAATTTLQGLFAAGALFDPSSTAISTYLANFMTTNVQTFAKNMATSVK
jgi:hypothetical protein